MNKEQKDFIKLFLGFNKGEIVMQIGMIPFLFLWFISNDIVQILMLVLMFGFFIAGGYFYYTGKLHQRYESSVYVVNTFLTIMILLVFTVVAIFRIVSF
jgi:hypothetical protein